MLKTEAGAAPSASGGELPFEDALRKLESIVEAMESEDLPLEALLGKYEEGSRLVQVCQSKLAEADLKIQRLERDEKGKLTLKPVSIEQ